MKSYITRINGWSLQDKSHYVQHMVAEIAHQLGYREMGIYRYYAEDENWESLSSRLDGIIAGINNDDIVVLQFPTGNGIRFENELTSRLKTYGGRIAIFIQEMDAMLYEERKPQIGEIISLFNKAEVLIVPTYAMRGWLLENGVHKGMKFVVQEMWDYTTKEFPANTPTLGKGICFTEAEGFAGMNDWNYAVPLNLYNVSANQGNVQNLGEREPYKLLSELNAKGGFGLVWYRDEYSRQYMENYISFSLARYLAAGIPVIVPVGISHQTLIEMNHLGIVVNSLDEAAAAVNQMTEEEYQKYVKSVAQFAPALRNGYFTKKCLVEAQQAFYRKDVGGLPFQERVYETQNSVFRSITMNESYGGNLAFSWDFKGEAEGFLIYDTTGTLLEDTQDLHQHYFLLKEQEGKKGVIIKAYVETLKGKLIIAESEPAYIRERGYGSPKVSIIVPAYNAEDYIVRCIDTALAQSLPDVEVIIVDDGSTDRTPRIIEWYAERYENVVAIHQENGGVAAARNTGIGHANGEYIGFMDNDDMIRPNMAERLYKAAKKNDCDIAITSVYQITDNGYEVFVWHPLEEDIAIQGDKFIQMLNTTGWMYSVVIWNKLYKSSLIKNRLFPLIVGDDGAWTPYILSYADKVCYLNDYSYEYDRIIRPHTLVDKWQDISKEERLLNYKNALSFYLKNGNPKRISLLKYLARQDLSSAGEVYADDAYEKLWQQLDADF